MEKLDATRFDYNNTSLTRNMTAALSGKSTAVVLDIGGVDLKA